MRECPKGRTTVTVSCPRKRWKDRQSWSSIRAIVDSREFGRLATNAKASPADIKALNGWRDVMPHYVKDYVALNTFAA
jgi:hypothetical protein